MRTWHKKSPMIGSVSVRIPSGSCTFDLCHCNFFSHWIPVWDTSLKHEIGLTRREVLIKRFFNNSQFTSLRTHNCTIFFLLCTRDASLIADKYNKPYSRTIHWLRCRLSFSLLRSAIMCLRGSRSSIHHPINSLSGAIDQAVAEGQASC